MKIETYYPSEILSPFVREYKIIESNEQITNHILPDTAIVLAFRFNMPLLRINGVIRKTPGSLVTGISPIARQITYSDGAKTLLVLFKEGGASAFFRIPLYELFGKSTSLEDLLPQYIVNEIESKLYDTKTNIQKINVVESFLLGVLVNTETDELISCAVREIKKNNGHTNIRELANSLNISIDSFEKKFRKLTGTTPKHFSTIVKIRQTIQLYPATKNLTALAYEMDYFDQSHFIKDFKKFIGITPKEFFKNGISKNVW